MILMAEKWGVLWLGMVGVTLISTNFDLNVDGILYGHLGLNNLLIYTYIFLIII
jgi:hypothetical protein